MSIGANQVSERPEGRTGVEHHGHVSLKSVPHDATLGHGLVCGFTCCFSLHWGKISETEVCGKIKIINKKQQHRGLLLWMLMEDGAWLFYLMGQWPFLLSWAWSQTQGHEWIGQLGTLLMASSFPPPVLTSKEVFKCYQVFWGGGVGKGGGWEGEEGKITQLRTKFLVGILRGRVWECDRRHVQKHHDKSVFIVLRKILC